MAITIKLRSDTKQNWYEYNPTLAKSEMGLETDTRAFKFGNGITPWRDLEYASTSSEAADSIKSIETTITELTAVLNNVEDDIYDISSDIMLYAADIVSISSEIYNTSDGIIKQISANYNEFATKYNDISSDINKVSSSAIIANNYIFGFTDTIGDTTISANGLINDITALNEISYNTSKNLEIISSNISNVSAYVYNSIDNLSSSIKHVYNKTDEEVKELSTNIDSIIVNVSAISGDVNTKANKEHTHNIDNIIDLQNELDAKVNTIDYDEKVSSIILNINSINSNIITIDQELTNKANKEHTHNIEDITHLQNELLNNIKANGIDYNTINNFIGLKDISELDNRVSANEFAKKIIDIINSPKNYSDELLESISSELAIYNDGIIFDKNNTKTRYSFDPTSEWQVARKSDIRNFDNLVEGKNIKIKHPSFNTSNDVDRTWNIMTEVSSNDGTVKPYQVYFRQDITDVSSTELSSYKEATRLVSDTEVYAITNKLSIDISNLDTRVDVALANLERYEELSANINIDTKTSSTESKYKAFKYVAFPLTAAINSSNAPYEFTSECYNVESVTITTASNLREANNIFNYYDYYTNHVCAVIYIVVKELSENNTEYIKLIRLARSTNSFVLENSKTYEFTFESAISKIYGNTIFIGFEMVHSEEKISFPVDKIVELPSTDQNAIGVCLNENDIENPNILLSVPSMKIHGSILKDIVDILAEHIDEVSAEIYTNIAVAVKNLTKNLETVSSGLYTDLTSTSSELYTDLTSVSSELYADLTSTSSELYTNLTTVSSDLNDVSGNAILTKNITLTGVSNVGALSNGDTLLAGTSLSDILSRMLQVEQKPTIVKPCIKYNGSTSKQNIYRKFGTALSSIGSLTATYINGTYNNDPTNSSNPILNANAPVSAYVITYENLNGSSYTTINETSATTATSYVLPYNKSNIDYLPNTTLTYTIKCYYDNGDAIISNTGVQHPTGTDVSSDWMVVAGNTNTLTTDIIGYRPYYYGVLSSQIISNEISSDEAVAELLSELNESTRSITNGNSFNININTNTMAVVFAYDASLREVSQVKNNGNNLDITEKFKEDKSLFDKTVYGENNQYPIKYNIYYMNYNTKPTSDTTYTITI